MAVNNAIRIAREEGRCALVMAHRPAAIEECDKLLYIDGGIVKAFGPAEEVKAQVLANRQQIDRAKGKGGGVA